MVVSKVPLQEEIVLATVQGKEVTSLPEDLYVPPNSLKIFLETFAGPLDFLLYLIKKQNLDILDIDVANITEQYTSYIDLMESFQIELAGDYLVMAAYLAELKSRMLLPRSKETEEEEDPNIKPVIFWKLKKKTRTSGKCELKNKKFARAKRAIFFLICILKIPHT